MSTFRQLRNFWILWVTTALLACFGNAVAQASYSVTDLGTLANDNQSCAMPVNNQGWTEIMTQFIQLFSPPSELHPINEIVNLREHSQ